MARRFAVLIGNQTFRPESGLPDLSGPINDLEAFASVLGDESLGNFEVRTFCDESRDVVMHGLDVMLSEEAVRGDLVIIFYAGHGRLNRDGELCLAASNTITTALYSSSIPASALRKLVTNSYCNNVVLLLDCCHSGAVSQDAMRGSFESQFNWMANESSGFHILTASSALQTARETRVANGRVMGRFTDIITEGIRSGAADVDRDGAITISDLCQYLSVNLSAGQTPQYFAHRASGNPVIALRGANASRREADHPGISDHQPPPQKARHFPVVHVIAVIAALLTFSVVGIQIGFQTVQPTQARSLSAPLQDTATTPQEVSTSQDSTIAKPPPSQAAAEENHLLTVDDILEKIKASGSSEEKSRLKAQARALLADDLNFGSFSSGMEFVSSNVYENYRNTDYSFISYDAVRDELVVRVTRSDEFRGGNLSQPKPAGHISYDVKFSLGKLYRLMPRTANSFELSGDFGVAVWHSNPKEDCPIKECIRYFPPLEGGYVSEWFSDRDLKKIRKFQSAVQKIMYEIDKA